jgi:Thiamine pyrophosphate enzyme, N-terminal TPP binding domain/alpha/beta hydrolase fold
MARMNAVDAAVLVLEREGVSAAFGVPGAATNPLYAALRKRGSIRHILARHVEGASHMADGYTRAKPGNIGVCIGTSGPAGTDMITGLYAAAADSIPILCITGQALVANAADSSSIRPSRPRSARRPKRLVSHVRPLILHTCGSRGSFVKSTTPISVPVLVGVAGRAPGQASTSRGTNGRLGRSVCAAIFLGSSWISCTPHRVKTMSAANVNQRSRSSIVSKGKTIASAHPYVLAAAVSVGVLAISALVNRHFAKAAEHDNPPTGKFLEVNGVRLHYFERGSGAPLVLLHGNGSMIQDFESSGLIDLAAKTYRVIVFDRPGFGHSNRPRNVVWTPAAQAELLRSALGRLGVSGAIVLGHSWGASVAVALALKYPELVQGLVLASGYYYTHPFVLTLWLCRPRLCR